MALSASCGSSCVKLYLCSNPEDSVVERKALREGVFPRFREHCRHALGLDIRVIDPFESSDRSKWPDENCRKQMIKECRESSAGPFLLALVGHEYGTAALPSQVAVSEYQLLLQESQRSGTSTHELEKIYCRDENTIPPSYCLKSQAETEPPDECRNIFQSAVHLCVLNERMTPERAQSYCRSTLDIDLRTALEDNAPTDISGRCLIYIHKVTTPKDKSSQQQKDILKSSLLSDETLHSSLCDDFLLGLVRRCNLLIYTTTTHCPHGLTTGRRRVYAQSLCHQVHSDLVKLTDNLNICNYPTPEPLFCDAFNREQKEQAEMCQILSQFYEIKHPEEDEIRKYVQSEQWRPLLITGGPCTGKTVLMAHCSLQINSWLPDSDPVVIPHFCSFSLESSPRHVLSTLCYQIAKSYHNRFSAQQNQSNFNNDSSQQTSCHTDNNLDVPFKHSNFRQPHLDNRLYTDHDMSISELKRHISALTSSLPSPKYPLIVLIGGLDQMDCNHGLRVIESLPSPLPPNVKVLLTVSSTRKHILKTMELHYPQCTMSDSESDVENAGFFCVKLGLANRKERVKMLASLLSDCGRSITSGQQALVNQALISCSRPLYIRLLHKLTSNWHSDSEVTESTLPDGVHSCISSLLEHLQSKHGLPLVSSAVCYLTLSRTGLTGAELSDLLSSDNKVIALYMKHCDGNMPKLRVPQVEVETLILDLEPFLCSRTVANSVVLFWMSRHFRLVIAKTYLESAETISNFHSDMADYYSGRWSGGYAKPFDQDDGETKLYIDRQPSSQPFFFTSSSKEIGHVNLKKILELPYHLKESGRHEELHKLILTLDFQQAMVRSGLLLDLVAMMETEGGLCKEYALLAYILKSSACFLNDFPTELPSVMELTCLPFKSAFRGLEGYADEIQQERKKREVGVVLHPAPSTVHTFKCVKSQVKGKLRDAVVTQSGNTVQVMDDSSVWVCKSDDKELAKLMLKNEFEFDGLKTSGHFVLLSTVCRKHFLWDETGADFLIEVKDLNGTPNMVENVFAAHEKVCIQWKDEPFVSTFEVCSGRLNHFHCQSIVTCVSWFSDKLFAGQDEGTFSIFDMSSTSLLRTCSNPKQKALVLIFAGRCKQQIGCIDKIGNISLWDISEEAPKVVQEKLLNSKLGDVIYTEYSRETYVLLVCQSQQVTLWDTWEWGVIDQFIAPKQNVFKQALLSPDGHFLLALLDKSSAVLVWKLATGECILSLRTCQPPHTLFKSPFDIICVSTDGSISSWDSEMVYVAGVAHKMSREVREVVIELDGDGFFTSDGSERVWKWSLEKGQPCACLLHSNSVEKLCLSTSKVYLVTLSADDIYVWQNGSEQNIMRISGSKASDILITPNGNFGVSLCKHGLSRVWKLVSGAPICTIHLYLSGAQISAESTFLIGLHRGELLAASLWSGTIHKRFSCDEISEVAAFQTLANHPNFVIVLLALGSLYTWNVAEETVLRHFKIPINCPLKEIQLSSNGGFALLSTVNAKLTILDLSQFRICSFKTRGDVVTACLDTSECYAICCTRQKNGCQCYLHTRPVLTVIRLEDGVTMGNLYLPKLPVTLTVNRQNCVFVGFEDGAVGVYYFVADGEQPAIRTRQSHVSKCPLDEAPSAYLSLTAPNIVWSKE